MTTQYTDTYKNVTFLNVTFCEGMLYPCPHVPKPSPPNRLPTRT
jgi:hypothetical protein